MQAGRSNLSYFDQVAELRIILLKWVESYDDPMVGVKEVLLYILDAAAKKGVVIEDSLLLTIKYLGIKELTHTERNQIRDLGVSSGIAKDFTTPTLTETKRIRWEHNTEELYIPNPDEGLRSLLNSKTKPINIYGIASKARTFINTQTPYLSATPDGIYDFFGVLCPIEFRKAKEVKKIKEVKDDADEDDSSYDEHSDHPSSISNIKGDLKLIKRSRYQRSLNNLSQSSSLVKRKGPKKLSTKSQALEWREGVPQCILNDKIVQIKHQIYCLRAPFGLLLYRSNLVVYYQFIERDNQCVNLALERQNNFLNFKNNYEAEPTDPYYELSLYRDFNRNNHL